MDPLRADPRSFGVGILCRFPPFRGTGILGRNRGFGGLASDNVLKPFFISRQAKLPLPLVLVGASGGVLGFGVIGIFVGPVVMGLVRSLWLGWVSPDSVFEDEKSPEVLPDIGKEVNSVESDLKDSLFEPEVATETPATKPPTPGSEVDTEES